MLESTRLEIIVDLHLAIKVGHIWKIKNSDDPESRLGKKYVKSQIKDN